MEIQLPDGTVLDAPDGLSPEQIKKLVFNFKTKNPSAGSAAMTAKSEAAIAQAKQAGAHPSLASFAQGALQNYGDEMIGAIEAIKSGFRPGAYEQSRDKARGFIGAAQQEAGIWPGIAGSVTTGMPAAMATGATSLPAVMGVGAAEGGASAYGAADKNDANALAQTLLGATVGAGASAAGYGLGKLIEKFTAKGLAAATIQKAMDGNTDDLVNQVQQLGGSPAEVDEVLREVLRGQSAKNPSAAASMVPAAQQRIADVNAQTVSDVNNLISPDNAAMLVAQLQKKGQQLADAGYKAAYSNPATAGLIPEIANNPAMADAVKAAQKLAAAQGRTFDITNLGIQDLDALERALRTYSTKMFESTPENTLMGPVYSDLSKDIGKIATDMSPELAATRAQYAVVKSAQEAVDLGQQALNPSKEFVQVADEFASLTPDAQEAYKAGMATKLRTLLQQKSPTSNAGVAINKEAIIEKLKAVGFPEASIDAIIKRGQGARGVLDALVGGSDTARKLAAASASESPLTQIKPQDLMAGALVHPATVGILPALRSAGAAQERSAAAMLIRALASQNPYLLQQLMQSAPQRLTPFFGLGMAGASAPAGSMVKNGY